MFNIKDGLEKGEVRHWTKDENFKNQILRLVITESELEKLIEPKLSDLNEMKKRFT